MSVPYNSNETVLQTLSQVPDMLGCSPSVDLARDNSNNHDNHTSHEVYFGFSHLAENTDEVDRNANPICYPEWDMDEIYRNNYNGQDLGVGNELVNDMELQIHLSSSPILPHARFTSQQSPEQIHRHFLEGQDYDADSENSEGDISKESEALEWEIFDESHPMMNGVIEIKHEFAKLTPEERRKFLSPARKNPLRIWGWEPSPLRSSRTVVKAAHDKPEEMLSLVVLGRDKK